ncbi:hypothetical protein MANES_07G137401v8 [Manihot esculenta]|uniref:Uncharacterized protein n=1 Tax=Manihot esculenta TaxID=3983 RepID=A0ACB7HHU6_MANES|nr:hypothetical protein MANES_07G137401v8 [Manihot esculenta]
MPHCPKLTLYVYFNQVEALPEWLGCCLSVNDHLMLFEVYTRVDCLRRLKDCKIISDAQLHCFHCNSVLSFQPVARIQKIVQTEYKACAWTSEPLTLSHEKDK